MNNPQIKRCMGNCSKCGKPLTEADREQVERTMFFAHNECRADYVAPTVKPAEQIGIRFAQVLREWLTDAEWLEMRRRNVEHVNDGICASHDFCDANMAMHQAFMDCGQPDPAENPQDDAVLTLWGDAWQWAQVNRLTQHDGEVR